jgi:DNA polymerase (family 10)
LRELAQIRDYSLSDHSLLKPDGGEILLATEEELYAFFGMDWIPPELREDRGEIRAALDHHLPVLIQRSDLIAELHCHSTWSDGQVSIRAMAEGAIARGYQVLAITDHSGGLGVAGGMKIPDVQKQRKEIDQVQSELGERLRLLQGAEVEIHSDGSLDYPDEVLAGLNVVVASLHSGLRQPREMITERLVKAMHNPHVDIIGHPTGRLIPDREGADLDMEVVLAEAKSSGVALEINAHPSRLDLEDIYARRAVEMGIPLSINTDAHHPDQLDLLFYGVATARRGWVEAKDVINAWPRERLLKWLNRNS